MTPDSTPPNPDADASESPLVRLEHAVESAVEEAIAATERSLVQRFGTHCVRALRFALAAIWTALVVAFFTFGLLFLVTRYALLPRADQARSWLERECSESNICRHTSDARAALPRFDAISTTPRVYTLASLWSMVSMILIFNT